MYAVAVVHNQGACYWQLSAAELQLSNSVWLSKSVHYSRIDPG